MIIRNLHLGEKIVRQSGIAYVNDDAVVEAEWVCVRV